MSGLEKTIKANTLINILRHRSIEQPKKIAYTFLLDGETNAVSLTYGELDIKARAIAAYIQSLCSPQDRILLLYPPGLGFIEAFFACLYAETIAIPAYPPRPNRSIARIQSIIKDAQPTLALTTHSILTSLERKAELTPELKTLRWFSTDNIDISYNDKYQETPLASDKIAFLQYTSGSTAEPKGVKIAHHNLLHNLQAIYRCFQHSSQSRGVIWLPPYHDMGLIGGILQPLYGNFPVVLMSPLMFLQNPLRWLKAISRYRGTTSGGPNFAYDLCLRKFKPEQNLDLDLSSWDLAFNGAEPINYQTLEKFAATFAPYGFSTEAFYPCYGMAEATLIVSGGVKNSPVITKTVLAQDLEQDKVTVTNSTEPNSRTLVSCGHSLPDQKIVIVQPDTLTLYQPGKIGEIWVTGPSIALGYWNQLQATQDTFQASIPGFTKDSFLRTGDLGFIEDGELYVTGRIKDIIIIKGKNHYPQDIERTVEASNSWIRPYCTASFTINIQGEEKLVILAEVDRRYWDRRKSKTKYSENNSEQLKDRTREIIRSIRRQVSQQHDLQVHNILLLKPGSIPKTSSGKIQRHVCRANFLDGSLDKFKI
ncbi:MAG: fatty acyl-AMP ligase [Xenococcaceae cyanobacterium MO_234.B1]|nr:fatty acyl-AMP ligase [Xenococcaceae cyanobacterium MO_234.B1]